MKRSSRFTLANILWQALNPKRLAVMTKKVGRRVADTTGKLSEIENLEWIKNNCTSFSTLAMQLDPALWREAEDVSRTMEAHAESVLSNIEYNLGGGGVYPFLYFITRLLRPGMVVETGVAAGFSSYAFLAAMERNGQGRLYSSDFPYFRLPNPEKFIGVVVEDRLKDNWRLFIDGDEANLPKILSELSGSVDLFHYDSDKSYTGRRYAMDLIAPRMSEHGVILMDDIQDNSFFHDYVAERDPAQWRVFEFQGKYVGMIGDLRCPL